MIKKNIIVLIIILIFISIITGTKVFSNSKKNKNINESTIEDKYKELGNIHKKISYFKDEYLDRYISYKKRNKNISNNDVVLNVNMGLDHDFYTNVQPALKPSSNQVLVNKYYYLEENYVPNDLKTVNTKFSVENRKLVNAAKVSFEFLAKKAYEEGYTIRAVSAYRSYSYQSSLYNNYVNQDGVLEADKYSARPGFSEHQTGLAVDVDNRITNYNNFESTKEYKWMLDNAHKYGFILRYPKGKEDITGYMYEPWHYRYVGVKIASFIHQNNITYEEYYFKYLDK